MKNLLLIPLVSLILGMILMSMVILFFWWLKLRKIKKNMPQVNNIHDIKKTNYDFDHVQKKTMKREEQNNEQTGNRRSEEKISLVGGGEDEITRLKREIATKERELRQDRNFF